MYQHNNVVHDGFVLDNAAELANLFKKYQVKVDFAGHIHAQNIIGPSKNCPTIEVDSSCFSMSDQGYGVIELKPQQLTYHRHSFEMQNFLTKEESKKLPASDFHKYLFKLFNITNAEQMQWLSNKISDKKACKAVFNLILKLNWNFFIGKSNYSNKEANQIKNGNAYQVVKDRLPELKKYVDSLLSVKEDSQHLIINY